MGLRGWSTYLVFVLLYLDVRGRVWACSVCHLLHFHLFLLRQPFFCSHSPYHWSHRASGAREACEGSSRNRSLLRLGRLWLFWRHGETIVEPHWTALHSPLLESGSMVTSVTPE